ncbi:MAG TPA: holo-ACP synthase [Terracidiphilus sp.]|nr:holo-ACP synthase [Terracidiphilus sp.]
MIVGTGIDITEISRIQNSLDRFGQRFLDRIYTPAEQAYCLRKRKAAESLAARFAAKEAGAKALGTGISHGVNWLEIEVVREPSGRPTLRFHGRAAQFAERLGATHASLSLTHTGELAMASVILEDVRPSAILKA